MRAPSGDQPPKSWITARSCGQRARFGVLHADRCSSKLLAFVAAAVDAIDQPVIHRRAAQQRDLLVVEGELPVGAARQVQRPDLRQSRTAQVEQRLSVTGEGGRRGGADGDEGFRVVRHGTSIPAAGLGKHERDRVCSGNAAGRAGERDRLGGLAQGHPLAGAGRRGARGSALGGALARRGRRSRCRRQPAASACSRTLVSLASLAIQARDPTRFDLLYRPGLARQRRQGPTDDRRCVAPRASPSRCAPRRTGCAPMFASCRSRTIAPLSRLVRARRTSCWRPTRN